MNRLIEHESEDAPIVLLDHACAQGCICAAPHAVDPYRMAGCDGESICERNERLARQPTDPYKATHQRHAAARNHHAIASAHVPDAARLKAVASGARHQNGRVPSKAAASRTRVVGTHIDSRCGSRGASRGSAATGRTRSRYPIIATGCGNGRGEAEEDPIASLAHLLEGGAAIMLQARVHKVGALLELMGSHQRAQIVLAPPIEALLAAQSLRHTT